ncbi:hypothetical protein Tco_1476724 [Tanacetum coccineum]
MMGSSGEDMDRKVIKGNTNPRLWQLAQVYKEAGYELGDVYLGRRLYDLDSMVRSIRAKDKDLSVISELLKYMSSEGFDLMLVLVLLGSWVWLEFDSYGIKGKRQDFKGVKEIFLEFKDEVGVVGWGQQVFTDMVSAGPMFSWEGLHGKEVGKIDAGEILEDEFCPDLIPDVVLESLNSKVVNPTEEAWQKRFQIINDLGVVGTLEVLRGATSDGRLSVTKLEMPMRTRTSQGLFPL